MEIEQPLEQTESTTATCDAWGHVLREQTLTEEAERPIITCECDLWGHPCPGRFWAGHLEHESLEA